MCACVCEFFAVRCNPGPHTHTLFSPFTAPDIVSYMKKQVGPNSVHLESLEDAEKFFKNADVAVVGFFAQVSGETCM